MAKAAFVWAVAWRVLAYEDMSTPIKQIWAVEYKGTQYTTCLTEDGVLMRYERDLVTGKESWEKIVAPEI